MADVLLYRNEMTIKPRKGWGESKQDSDNECESPITDRFEIEGTVIKPVASDYETDKQRGRRSAPNKKVKPAAKAFTFWLGATPSAYCFVILASIHFVL